MRLPLDSEHRWILVASSISMEEIHVRSLLKKQVLRGMQTRRGAMVLDRGNGRLKCIIIVICASKTPSLGLDSVYLILRLFFLTHWSPLLKVRIKNYEHDYTVVLDKSFTPVEAKSAGWRSTIYPRSGMT